VRGRQSRSVVEPVADEDRALPFDEADLVRGQEVMGHVDA